jgi:hypothetical protein
MKFASSKSVHVDQKQLKGDIQLLNILSFWFVMLSFFLKRVFLWICVNMYTCGKIQIQIKPIFQKSKLNKPK